VPAGDRGRGRRALRPAEDRGQLLVERDGLRQLTDARYDPAE